MRRLLIVAVMMVASISVASAQGSWSPVAPQTAVKQAGCSGCAPAAAPVVAAPAPVAASGCNACETKATRGCNACEAKGSLLSRAVNPFLIGPGCASTIGCNSFAAQRSFMFGGCNQFFNPGNKCGIMMGSGGLGNHDNCKYGTYLNR
ncbi:MAG: hypothetical protein ACRC8S_09175 [Fimbriiglobus sp.]